MLSQLFRNAEHITKSGESQSAMILKEIERQYKRKEQVENEIAQLHAMLPILKNNFQKLIKTYGLKNNNITRKDVTKAQNLHAQAVNEIERLRSELEEIEETIAALQDEAQEELSAFAE